MESQITSLINDENRDSSKINSKNTNPFYKNKVFKISIFTFFIIIISILLLIIFLVLIKNSNKKDESDDYPIGNYIGIINCTFNIDNISENIPILGDEFQNDSEIDIIIDKKRIEYSKTYNFKKIGDHNIQYILYNNISMDYMFKDLYNLRYVEMISDKNCEIYSMISTFENCENLEKFENFGFNTIQVNSMKRLFYNTKIFEWNFINISTNNVEDISYMFGGIKSEKINILNFNTSKVLNMSHLFENCNSLKTIDFPEIDTSNAIDISFMFNSCYSLTEINLNTLKTNKVRNMSYLFNSISFTVIVFLYLK